MPRVIKERTNKRMKGDTPLKNQRLFIVAGVLRFTGGGARDTCVCVCGGARAPVPRVGFKSDRPTLR